MRLPRIGCLGWSLLAAGVVLALPAIGWAWYRSEADLRRVEAEARAAGVATTAAELGAAPDALRQRAFDDLVVLAGRHPSWREADSRWLPAIGQPPPAGLAAQVAAVPAEHWDAVRRAVAACAANNDSASGDFTGLALYRTRSAKTTLEKLLAERIMATDAAALPPLVEGLVALALLADPRSPEVTLHGLGSVRILADAVTRRLSDLRDGPGAAAVAAALRTVRERLWRDRDRWLQGAFVAVLAEAREIRGASRSGLGPGAGATALQRVLWRWQRAAVLRAMLAHLRVSRSAADPGDLLRHDAAVPPAVADHRLLDRLLPRFPGEPSYGFMRTNQVRGLLAVEVLIGELDPAAAPLIDHFDPRGAPLHPVLRDGRRVGWYSVGEDGRDDGGLASSDYGIPTAASLGREHFADAPGTRTRQ